MNINISALSLILVAFLISCSTESGDSETTGIINNPGYGIWQGHPESPLEFELEQTFGDNEEIIFAQSYQLQGPVTDDTGNLYIIDSEKGSMYSFDSEGSLRWETGEEGKGPGDFERPRGLVTDGDYLYTSNINGSRIDQFDFEGNLLNSTSLENLDLSFITVEGFLSDSILVATSTLWGKLGEKINIFKATDSLKLVHQFEIVVAPKIDLGDGLSSGINIHTIDSLIAVGNLRNYAVQFYNSRGNKVKTIKRDFNKLVRPGFFSSDGMRTISSFGGLNPPLLLSDGYYINTLSWPTNIDDPDQFLKTAMTDRDNARRTTYRNSIDLYDADGTLLYSLEQEGQTPDVGSISHVDADGRIYTKADEPYPQVRRYSLTINNPD